MLEDECFLELLLLFLFFLFFLPLLPPAFVAILSGKLSVMLPLHFGLMHMKYAQYLLSIHYMILLQEERV
jgi:hypothetical protein